MIVLEFDIVDDIKDCFPSQDSKGYSHTSAHQNLPVEGADSFGTLNQLLLQEDSSEPRFAL